VRARFVVTDPSVLPVVSSYLNSWVDAHRIWKRIWRGADIQVEVLDFQSEFFSAPQLEFEHGDAAVYVVFEGKPDARMWKDWMVRLVGDIEDIFPELKFERFG
jgi:hypothetical protein